MADSDDLEQRALQQRRLNKQIEGTEIGPERAQFWNMGPPMAEQFLAKLPAPASPAFSDAITKLFEPQTGIDETVEGLARAVEELREQIAENTRAIAELKKALTGPGDK